MAASLRDAVATAARFPGGLAAVGVVVRRFGGLLTFPGGGRQRWQAWGQRSTGWIPGCGGQLSIESRRCGWQLQLTKLVLAMVLLLSSSWRPVVSSGDGGAWRGVVEVWAQRFQGLRCSSGLFWGLLCLLVGQLSSLCGGIYTRICTFLCFVLF